MLGAIGVDSIEALFDEIPDRLLCGTLEAMPTAVSEVDASRLMSARARLDGVPTCFIGAGAYDHYVPAAVWQIAARGEFYSASAPCQAEASQGTLQLLYEFQSMMAALTAMDVSNASLYDGASALAEAVLMAVRINRKSKSRRVLVPKSLHPAYRRVAGNIVRNQGIVLEELPYDPAGGHIDPVLLQQYDGLDITALVIPQPNFFGVLEEADTLVEWARVNGAVTVAVVNPLSLSVLSPPGEWGERGVDICCGDGQPLGAPLSSGGPYFGFLCCRQAFVRHLPGWIVGRTLDVDGKTGFTLTLHARNRRTRRSGAASNICTNQGLMVTAATIHMALMGAEGLSRTAASCHSNTLRLGERLSMLPGVSIRFDRPVFHEQVVTLPVAANGVLRTLAAHNVLGGLDLSRDYPELGNAILFCATERRTAEEIEIFTGRLERAVALQGGAPCRLQPKGW